MEKRKSRRLPANIKIFIYRNYLPVACCDTRDIGMSGIFAITGPLIYKHNTEVNIQFDLQTSTGHKYFALPARVRYTNVHGMGLEFDRKDNAMLDLWQDEFKRINTLSKLQNHELFNAVTRHAMAC